ncbi:MAG: SusC/RagA family TonB-linked outer membrane protein [Prevotella sp.]|jgi:iron complex outermembrane receptor protein|nr:SusC/RagA family TonB-linked outer membrane protein [Prevotella sp.]
MKKAKAKSKKHNECFLWRSLGVCLVLFSVCFWSMMSAAPAVVTDIPESILAMEDMKQDPVLTANGTVTDTNGEPLPGVSIVEKGKPTNGTMTDVDGKFSLKVTSGAILNISFLGFEKQEVKAGIDMNIVLKEQDNVLDDVVVTALGISRDKKSLGYAISSIKGDDLMVAGVPSNPLAAIYGKASGVGLAASASGPTGGINIKVRGATQLETSSSTRPLFVVDGVPIYDRETSMATKGYDPFNSFDYGAGINDINAEDIESMEILKGAKASVLYGSAGANGVVLITTKKGASTRGLGVTLSLNHTFEEPVSFIDFQNEYGSGANAYSLETNDNNIVSDYRNFGPKFDGREITYWDGSKRKYQAYQDNYNDLFRSGSTNNLQIAIAGGNEKGNMRFAYTNYQFDGLMQNHWQKKHTLSFAGQMNISPFAKMELTANLYKVQTHNRYPNIYSLMSTGFNRDYDYQTIANSYLTSDGYKADLGEAGLPGSQTQIANILWQQRQNSNLDDKTHLISSIRNTFQFHPLISLVTLAGIDYTQTDYTRKDKVTAIEPTVKGGKYRFDTDQHSMYNLQANLNYDQSFLNDNLRITAIAGGEFRNAKDYNIYTSTYGNLSYPDWYSLNNGPDWPGVGERDKVLGHERGQESMYSAYASVTASWKDRYYLEIQGRNDWASTLPKGNNSYFYPGISFNYNFSEDIRIPQLQFGKVRLAWADVGRPATRYFALRQYTLTTIPNTEAQTVTPPTELFSGNIKPERKREFEIGTNLRFFPQNRIEFEFSYYNSTIYDQIMGIPLTSATGYDKIKINAGKVKNYGYEVLLKGAILAQKDYRWDVTLNLANQFSKVDELYGGITRHILASNNGWQVVAETGKRAGEIMTYDYLRTSDGQRIVGADGLYQLDKDAGFKTVGNVNPSLIGGIATDFYYKNLNVHIGMDYSFGSRLISMSNYYLLGTGTVKKTLANRDEASGGIPYYIDGGNKRIRLDSHSSPVPADSKDGRIYHDGMILDGVKKEGDKYVKNDVIVPVSTYWGTFIHDMQDNLQPDFIYKNNYLKMREIALSYTLPKKISEKAKLQKVTLTLTGRNLFYLYKSIPNIDSESLQGTNNYVEYSVFPMHRSWGFGINVSF